MADDVPSPKTQADHLEALAKVDAALKRRSKRIVGTVDRTLVDADYEASTREQQKTVRKIPFTKYEQDLHKYLDTLGSQVSSQSYNLKGRPVVALGFEVDPTNPSTYNGLYRPKMRGIPNAILKRLAIQAELPAACALTRSTQVSAFGQPRMNRFDKGFVFEPKVGVTDRLDAEEKAKLDQRIERAVSRMERCGVTDEIEDVMPPVQRRRVRSFAQFLHETARDAVVVGQIAVERVWSDHLEESDRKLMCFFPRDAGTIYRSCSTLEKGASYREQGLRLIEKLNKLQTGAVIDAQKWIKDEYAYWQVIEGQHRMVFTDREMVVLNCYPVSDVEMDGYPVTPMDIAVNAITTHLHIGTHNRLYFQSGRAARGMVVITSDEVSEDAVANIRQQLKAVVNGSQNAWTTPVFGVTKDDAITWQAMDSQGGRDMEFQYLADANTRSILTAFQMGPEELTAYGYLSRGTNSQALSECLSPSVRFITPQGLVTAEAVLAGRHEAFTMLWSGERWTEGRVFRTGVKAAVETELECGIKLETSPDHRYRAVGPEGEPVWKHQAELVPGDYVLVNRTPVKGTVPVPEYKGRPLTLEMMELLGWVTGDGALIAPQERSGAQLHLFYHHERERDIWKRHDEVLTEFGLKNHHQTIAVSEEEQFHLCEKHGFNSTSPERIKNVVYDTDFYRWLVSWGFRSSKDGKVIPDLMHVLPVEYRQAFLRGYFSADGGKVTHPGQVTLTVQDDVLRDQTRQLLLGLGIRTLRAKGLMRESFGEKRFSYKLNIKDRAEFWRQIGFMQPHKQLGDEVAERWQHRSMPQSVAKRFLGLCQLTPAFARLDRRQRDNIRYAASGDRGCSLAFLIRSLEQCDVSVPAWLRTFHMERIEAVRDLGRSIEMVDVEMFSDDHAFIAEGFQVHNSSTEWKLEAARDQGIRPLLSKLEGFVNREILPYLDPGLEKLVAFRFKGLDAETAEKESVRLQQDAPLHMTIDEILQQVEKKPVGKDLGGEVLLNPSWLAIVKSYRTKGYILEHLFGVEGASKDPSLAYIEDPMWFQWQQLQMEMKLQAQQAQAGGGAAGQPGQEPSTGDGNEPGGNAAPAPGTDDPARAPAQTERQRTEAAQDASAQGKGRDLGKAAGDAASALGKAEGSRRLLVQSDHVVNHAMRNLRTDIAQATKEIVLSVEELLGERSR